MALVLRRVLVGGIFLVPFTPLIVTSSLYFPFVTGKGFAFRILIELLCALWFLLALIDERYHIQRSWLSLGLGALVLTSTVSALLGVNPTLSLWGNLARMEGVLTLIHLCAYALLCTSVLQSERLWQRFFASWVLASVGVITIALGQFAGFIPLYRDVSEGRLDGTFGNAGFLASYLLLTFFLSLFLLSAHRQHRFWRLWYGSVAILSVFVLYHSATRSAALGLLAGLFVTGVLYLLHKKHGSITLRRIALLVGGILIIIGALFTISRTTLTHNQLLVSRFSQISLKNIKEQDRYQLWLTAWEGVREHPLLGWGQENFYSVYHRYYRPTLYIRDEPYADRAHNLILDWLVAGGVLGLASYLSLIALALYTLWHTRKLEEGKRSILYGFFAAYLVNNFFTFDSLASALLLWSVLAYLGTQYREQNGHAAQTLHAGKPFAVVGAALIFIYLVNGPALATAYYLKKGVRSIESNPRESLEFFNKALQKNSFASPEARWQFIASAVNTQTLNETPEELRTQLFSRALAEASAQLVLTPKDPELLYLTGTLLARAGSPEAAQNALEQARVLSPRKQHTLLRSAELAIEQKNYSLALQRAGEAFALNEVVDDARLGYAAAAIYSGRTQLVTELLVPRFGTTLVDDPLILRAYAESGQVATATRILERRLQQKPDDLQTLISLAAGYFKMGDYRSAARYIERAMTAHPDFTVIGQDWLTHIARGEAPVGLE